MINKSVIDFCYLEFFVYYTLVSMIYNKESILSNSLGLNEDNLVLILVEELRLYHVPPLDSQFHNENRRGSFACEN